MPFKDLVLKCAWCGRYRAGDDWVELEGDEAPDAARVTHGICPECLASLRASGGNR
jgi:hypothetical protein